MTEYVKLNYGDWVETYKPIDNQFSPNVPGGQLFQIPCSDDERGFLQDVDKINPDHPLIPQICVGLVRVSARQ